MLQHPFRQMRYHKYLLSIDTKYTEKHNLQLSAFKQYIIDNKTTSIKNPFTTPTSSTLTQQALIETLLLIAKQSQEASLKAYHNIEYLQSFILDNMDSLSFLLHQKQSYFTYLSFSIVRFLQKQYKNNQLRSVSKLSLPSLMKLLTSLLMNKQNSQKTFRYFDKERCIERHRIYQLLIMLISMQLIKQTDRQVHQAYSLNKTYTNISSQSKLNVSPQIDIGMIMKGISSCIYECQNEIQQEITRQAITVLSYLIIMNKQNKAPAKVIQFCFDNKLEIRDSQFQYKYQQKIIEDYVKSLQNYIKLDKIYYHNLHLLINNLLSLKISNDILSRHYDILVYLAKQKINPQLNKKTLKILYENRQMSQNKQFINENFMKILNSGIDMMQDQIQRYSIKLLEICSTQVQKIYAQLYYNKYNQNQNRILHETINQVFKIYLDNDLDLFKIQIMIGNQAINIDNNNMLRLHEKIKQKKQNFHLALLEIILLKRKEGNFKIISFNQIDQNTFINQNWLNAAGNTPEIYNIYLKIITQKLCQNTLQINPSLINMNSCIIKIQGEFFKRSLEFYEIILKAVEQHNVFQQKLFRYLLLCQAILGQRLSIDKYSYFSKFFSKIVHPESLFIMFMEYLVTLIKNKSSFLLYLQSLLEFQKALPQIFIQKKLYDISFLVRLIQQSQFFRISTYSIQSVAALYELALIVKDEQFLQDYLKIITIWSGNMSRSQVKNMQYLFIFRQIRKIYPYMIQRQLKNPKDRIFSLWNLLFSLLDKEEQSRQYLDMSPNKFIIQWKGDEVYKKGLQFQGTIIRNHNIQIFWHMHIETNLKFYKFNINNDRLVIYYRNSNEDKSKPAVFFKQFPLKQLKKNPEKIKLKLKIQSISKIKSILQVKLMQKLIQQPLEGNIQSIRICCKNNAYLYNISIQDLVSSGQLKHISSHLNLFNRWQVKLASLLKIKILKFIDKFDFDHAFLFIGEMLRYFKPMDISSGYELLFQLGVKLVKYVQKYKENQVESLKTMMKVFNIIEMNHSKFKGRNRELKPMIKQQVLKFCYKSIYYLFVSAILPYPFWSNFTKQTHSFLIRLLDQLLDKEYFLTIQNQNFQFFDKVLKLSIQHQDLFITLHKIIKKHKIDNILFTKYKVYEKQALNNSIYKKHLQELVGELGSYINLDSSLFHEEKARVKMLIANNIENSFQIANIDTKITILQCLAQIKTNTQGSTSTNIYSNITQLHPQLIQSLRKQHSVLKLIERLIKQIPQQQKGQLISLIITMTKISLMKKTIFKQKDINQYKNVYNKFQLYLELLILNRNHAQEDQIQQVLILILSVLKELNVMIDKVAGIQTVRKEFQEFFVNNVIAEYIVLLASQHNNKQENTLQNKIYSQFCDIVVKFQKQNFLSFLIKYRKVAQNQLVALKNLISNNKFRTLSLSSYSIFLQFMYEVLILIEHFHHGKQDKVLIYQIKDIRISVKAYLEHFINNAESITKITKPFLYSFPHVTGQKSLSFYSSDQNIHKKCDRLQSFQNQYQLKGGILFKLILIIFKLLSLNPQQSYVNLMEIFIFGSPKRNKKIQIFNTSPLGMNINLGSKQRSQVETTIAQYNSLYRDYYNKHDKQIIASPQEVNINTYVIDYVLLNLAEYLCLNHNKIQIQLLNKYHRCLVQGLSFKNVFKDMFQSLNSPKVELITYNVLAEKLENKLLNFKRVCSQEVKRNPTDDSNSPSSPAQSPWGQFTPIKTFGQNFEANLLRFTTPNRMRGNSQDHSHQLKKRIRVFNQLKTQAKAWSSFPQVKNIFKYFHDRAKQIRLIQLFHKHLVLQGWIQKNQTNIIVSKSRLKTQFENTYENKLIQQYNNSYESQTKVDQMIRKVRKIKPYTCQSGPVYKIMQNAFKNNTLPITLKVIPLDYSTKRLRNLQSLNMNFYEQFQQRQKDPEEQFDNNQSPQHNDDDNLYNQLTLEELDSPLIDIKRQNSWEKSYCQFITREGAYFCRYKIKEKKGLIEFQSISQRPNSEEQWFLKLGTPSNNIIKKSGVHLSIQFSEIQQIFCRKFNQICYNSLQFFLKNGTSKFVSFYTNFFNQKFIQILQKVLKQVKWIKDPVKEFEQMKFTQKWIQGNMTNFDYLMLLNKYGGRSYNDLNQYYVFPWILSDYQSKKIDLSNYKNYRDLSKPIGALNPQKLAKYRQKYRSQTHSQRCLYGSHYSTSLFVFYFMLRIQPFSSLHRQMQNGRWDVADRLFCSVGQVWKNLLQVSSTSDIKECIPQFYYMPSFLKNIANIQFGLRQNGQEVQDVSLPPWAQSSEQFIITMRAALQSDYVSQNLHLWIDLIFGKHQNSLQRNNIFHPYSYSDPEVFKKISKKNCETLQGIVCQISYFGQCPIQLFKKQHKPKKIIGQKNTRKSSAQHRNSQISTTISLSQQVQLPAGWKLLSFSSQNQDFILEIHCHIKQQKLLATIPCQTTNIKQCLEQTTSFKKNQKAEKNIQPRIKYKDLQLKIGNEFIMDLQIYFQFEKMQSNQIWIAFFGLKGLRIYNWQMKLYWSWQKAEVNYVHLQATRIIFSCPKGNLIFYSFYDKKIQEVQIFKDVCQMSMKTICLPRLPNKSSIVSNQINYRVLCVGDNKRLSIAQYSFEQTKNYIANVSQTGSNIN